jgi:PAS domain S-box-containing protein
VAIAPLGNAMDHRTEIIVVDGDSFDGRSPIGALTVILAAVVLAATFAPITAMAQGEQVKRVLVIHSFGSAAPPFTVEASAFENELIEKMDEHVDLDEVSLDMARYAGFDMEEAIVSYLEKRGLKWHPDIVVPIGSPAGRFIANYRERLFPETPILYASLDRRLLPAGALEKNATYIGQIYDIPGLLEDMLQVAPATKNIAVVIGATPLEQYWKKAFQEAAASLSQRINFIYFDDLSFDQMLEKAKTLPPNSYIFLLLLLRDAAGVTHNADVALQRLHAVANAPINSIFDHQMGLGILGGRLYQSELMGKEAAHVAIRILHGEPASSFEPKLIERLPPQYDARELRRWKIDEKRLPRGSTVLYRSPTAWQEYRGWIVLGGSIFTAQVLLISALLTNLLRRRRAEHSLAESEARFRNMADTAPVQIWMAGPDKLCTFFNAGWLAFTGRTFEQELGNGWTESVHQDDLKACLTTYENAFDAQKPFTMQYRIRRHDGVYRTITDDGVPRYDAAGKFLGYIGACLDITDLLQKETALSEFEERIALAAEAAQLGVWELDTATNEFWVSDKIRQLFQFEGGAGISYAEFQERVHPEDRENRRALVETAIESAGGYETEFRIVLPDGTLRWIAGRARCWKRGDSGSMRLLGVSMDVTKRRQAEELFRAAVEASPSGTVLLDPDARIVLVNAHIEKLFGYGREELIGQPVEVLLPQGSGDQPLGYRSNLIPAPQVGTSDEGVELLARRKDGTEFPVEISINPTQTPQGLLVLASVTDLSERKAAKEEARYRREQVELLSRVSLLGEMTASVAHELNQPLAAIMSNANAGMRFIDNGKLDGAQLREILEDVVSDGARAHDIISQVRRAIKKGEAISGRINLNDVVRNVAYMVQQDAVAHSCEVQMSLADKLPVIDGDPTQIRQVIFNLVSNAFDAMFDAPAANRKVEITTAHNGNGMVSVAVRDHGHGIPAAAQDRLFEHFFTTKEEGLGLGLAIVRTIIEAHGGRIAAENVKGGGARFSFNLPVSREITV